MLTLRFTLVPAMAVVVEGSTTKVKSWVGRTMKCPLEVAVSVNLAARDGRAGCLVSEDLPPVSGWADEVVHTAMRVDAGLLAHDGEVWHPIGRGKSYFHDRPALRPALQDAIAYPEPRAAPIAPPLFQCSLLWTPFGQQSG